jgi:hypothetical protein
MPDKSLTDKLRGRDQQIQDAVDAAQGTNQERDAAAAQGVKGVKASDNPHKPGSTLAKLWERKRQAGKLVSQN